VVRAGTGIRIDGLGQFTAASPTRFVSAAGTTWEMSGSTARVTDSYGTQETFERTAAATPSAAELQQLVGTYTSAEAETTLAVVVEDGRLVIKRRPDTAIRLTPVYADAFTGQLGTVIFRRTGDRVTALSVVQDRVWDLRFTRVSDAPSTQ
jgi:hypothetical protein